MSKALRLLRRNCTNGRKRPGLKREMLDAIQSVASDLDNGLSEARILKTIRQYRSRQKKLPKTGGSLPKEWTIEK